jgi:hypothetical protein
MQLEFAQSSSRPDSDNPKNTLKPDLTFEILNQVAHSQTDDQADGQLQKERSKLVKTLNERDLKSG